MYLYKMQTCFLIENLRIRFFFQMSFTYSTKVQKLKMLLNCCVQSQVWLFFFSRTNMFFFCLSRILCCLSWWQCKHTKKVMLISLCFVLLWEQCSTVSSSVCLPPVSSGGAVGPGHLSPQPCLYCNFSHSYPPTGVHSVYSTVSVLGLAVARPDAAVTVTAWKFLSCDANTAVSMPRW